MRTINSVIELREAIRQLEESQATQGRLLKQQFCSVVKRVQRASVIKNAVIELITSPGFLSALTSAVLSFSARRNPEPGPDRTSGRLFMRLLGVVVQFGIARLLSGKRGPRK